MGLRTHVEGARARIMASVELAVEAVPFGIIEAAAHLTVLTHSRGELSPNFGDGLKGQAAAWA